VSKDASRPFDVNSGNARVRAIGTQFDVYRRGSGVIVTVVEGKVAVTPAAPAAWAPTLGASAAATRNGQDERGGRAGEPVYLLAGEQVTVDPDKVVRAVHANVVNATAWTDRRLVFEGVPLGQVVEEFNRYNVRRLVIVDTALADVHIRGTFEANDPQPLLQFLRKRFAVPVEETQEEIRIGAKNSSRAQ
jgi:transmembrane sensor